MSQHLSDGEKANKSIKNKKVSLDSIMRTIFPPSMNIESTIYYVCQKRRACD